MVIEPRPALLGPIVIQTAELLECSLKSRLIQYLVMEPNRLEVFARHGPPELIPRPYGFPLPDRGAVWSASTTIIVASRLKAL